MQGSAYNDRHRSRVGQRGKLGFEKVSYSAKMTGSMSGRTGRLKDLLELVVVGGGSQKLRLWRDCSYQ